VLARFSVLLLTLVFAGCASTEAQIERALRTDRNPAAHARNLADNYRIHCPDTIEVEVEGRPLLSGIRAIQADGRVSLVDELPVLVSGKTASEAAGGIAEAVGLAESAVRVRVVEHNSQSVYVFGSPESAQHVVPYRGPETVLDLLQRVGLADSGATLGEIEIIRAHVADGKPPEVFHVDLRAVLIKHDLQGNIRLEPFDRIYIQQSRHSRMECCVPPVLQPLYRAVFEMK
jgi:protein involved in polysaccharide export with SLBB domain